MRNEPPTPIEEILFEAGLTPRQAQVLLRAADGLSYRQIAADLGISYGAVRVAECRGRKRLLAEQERRECLETLSDLVLGEGGS